jgi:hypothetical protein
MSPDRTYSLLESPLLTRADSYQKLRNAYASGRVRIVLDTKQLNKPGSLVYNALDIYVPALVLLTSSITLLFAFGLMEWTIALVFVLLWQIFGAPILVEQRLKRRTLNALLHGLESFSLVWGHSGIALVLAEYPENFCLSPNGDWQAFLGLYVTDDPVGQSAAANPTA